MAQMSSMMMPMMMGGGGGMGDMSSMMKKMQEMMGGGSKSKEKGTKKKSKDNANVVFVGGLRKTTEEDRVAAHFAKFGQVEHVDIKRLPDGTSRGFAFIKFADTEAVDKVIEAHAKHMIDNKWVEVKKHDGVAASALVGISCVALGLASATAAALLQRQPKGCSAISGEGLLGVLPKLWAAIRKHKFLDEVTQMHEKEGNTIFLQFGILRFFVTPLVITRDARNVEYMLKQNFENYPKGEFFSSIAHDLLGNGIFNVDGEDWIMQRKTASLMFTANRFKNHIWRVVQKNCGKVLDLLRAHDGDVDMFNILNRFTLDSIGEIGFGASIGSLENAGSPFLTSFDEAQRSLFWRFMFPGWRLLRFLGLGFERKARTHFKTLKEYSRQIILDLSQNLDTEAGDSFVGLFMKSDPSLSADFLTDMVLNFLLAGRDTTAQAMSWCLFLLMQSERVQEKVRSEISEVCGAEGIDYEKLNKLRYLDATLRESLRLYPSVPLDAKFVANADTLPDGTHVPRGAALLYMSYAMGRSQEIWGSDASEFRPERWLEMETTKSPYENPVFHAGPRECLGKRLAMVEMKGMLCALIGNFNFRLAAGITESIAMTKKKVLRSPEDLRELLIRSLEASEAHVQRLAAENAELAKALQEAEVHAVQSELDWSVCCIKALENMHQSFDGLQAENTGRVKRLTLVSATPMQRRLEEEQASLQMLGYKWMDLDAARGCSGAGKEFLAERCV
ncbi:CYP86A7, partial [Symbiodinium microadriaticum]